MTSERNQETAGCEAADVTTPLACAAGVRVRASELVLGVVTLQAGANYPN